MCLDTTEHMKTCNKNIWEMLKAKLKKMLMLLSNMNKLARKANASHLGHSAKQTTTLSAANWLSCHSKRIIIHSEVNKLKQDQRPSACLFGVGHIVTCSCFGSFGMCFNSGCLSWCNPPILFIRAEKVGPRMVGWDLTCSRVYLNPLLYPMSHRTSTGWT